uniref:U28-Hexatoxin-Hf1a_1 n=1 Tax=Hadronyche formidabilis TaxID=426499 RepID=A0A4Q8KAS5_HADFO
MLGPCVVILIAFAVAARSNEVCTIQNLEKCSSIMEPYPPNEVDYKQFPGKAFLNKYCSPVIETLDCFANIFEKCPGLLELVRQLPAVSSVLRLVHSICDEDSEIKKGYLANLDCYNEAVPQMEECIPDIVEIAEGFMQSAFRNESDDYLDTDCLFVPLVINCFIKKLTASCGAEGTVALAHIANEVLALMSESVCSEDAVALWEARFLQYVAEAGLELRRKKKK